MSKAKKKKLFVLALTLCLIGILATGTLAWYTTQSKTTAEFKTADSEGGMPDFEVDLTEEQGGSDVPLKGGATTPTYILPGDTVDRKIKVTNAGDYDQWIRVFITFDEWGLIFGSTSDRGMTPIDLLDVDETVWEIVKDENGDPLITEDVDKDTGTYTLYLLRSLAAQSASGADSEYLFTTLTIPEDFDQYDMCYENGDFSIGVLAQAIQKRNTGSTARAAFERHWKD